MVLNPMDSCKVTACLIQRSSSARKAAMASVPSSKARRTANNSGGRSKLPMCSARNGGSLLIAIFAPLLHLLSGEFSFMLRKQVGCANRDANRHDCIHDPQDSRPHSRRFGIFGDKQHEVKNHIGRVGMTHRQSE